MSVHDKDRWLKDIPGAIPRQKKKKPSKLKYTLKEYEIQEKVEEFLDDQGVKYLHLKEELMDAIFRSERIDRQTQRRLAADLRNFPDLTIFHPDIRIGKYNLTFSLELKREDGKLSHGQRDWVDHNGTTVTYNLEDAIKEITEFINLKVKSNDN